MEPIDGSVLRLPCRQEGAAVCRHHAKLEVRGWRRREAIILLRRISFAHPTGPVGQGTRVERCRESLFSSNTGDSGYATTLDPALATPPTPPASSSDEEGV